MLAQTTLLAANHALPPPCDRLVANILLNPLIELADRIASTVKPGGPAAFSSMLSSRPTEAARRLQEMIRPMREKAKETLCPKVASPPESRTRVV